MQSGNDGSDALAKGLKGNTTLRVAGYVANFIDEDVAAPRE